MSVSVFLSEHLAYIHIKIYSLTIMLIFEQIKQMQLTRHYNKVTVIQYLKSKLTHNLQLYRNTSFS